MTSAPFRKKLIEVALPLDAINEASVREGFIYRGNPSAVHKWWAQRPLAACRAVLFASLVDDPSAHPEKFRTEEAQETERQRLFKIIEELVKWENLNDQRVLGAAKAEILASTGGKPPPVYDPFCGGGSIPLEAQRLGLEAHGSDLNPVAVLITKALIEVPPKFAGKPPVSLAGRQGRLLSGTWKGAAGLAEDVRQYGQWMRDEAEKRIGKLYPKVKLPKQYGGGEATVIAWLWARTVKCPNPTCGAEMPLVRSFSLSTKKGKETHVEPVITGNTYRFEVKVGGKVPKPPKIGRGANFRCLCCEQAAPDDHIKREGTEGRMDARLMAIVAEGQRGRIYLPPTEDHEQIAASAKTGWEPDGALAYEPRAIWCTLYGLKNFADLFTPRQLAALTTLSELVGEARERVLTDTRAAGLPNDPKDLEDGGSGARAYADAVAMYLAFALDKTTEYGCTIVPWYAKEDRPKGIFARQGIPLVWDFAEVNVLGEMGGTFQASVKIVAGSLDGCPMAGGPAEVRQEDAVTLRARSDVMVSTDPPYYDNIGYADLSDFFYAWLRPTLKRVYPKLMGTMQVPKSAELIATPYRFGGSKERAQVFFEEGLGRAFERMRESQNPNYPLTVYYAFKQAETEEDDGQGETTGTHASTGWETMLEGLLKAGFSIHGTWPMRTERGARSVSIGTNALASSIVLVCRPRPEGASIATRGEFLRSLKSGLPEAIKQLQRGNIAPVDLAQASIGPGMGIFSRHSKVLESDGSAMSVRTALQLINKALDEYLTEQEGEFDGDTRFALTWFETYQFNAGPFGQAETLATARNVSVTGVVEAGILHSVAGKVRLLTREEMPDDWNPEEDKRATVWEATQHLIKRLESKGEQGASELLARLGSLAAPARDLAYRLYTTCERKKWAEDARAYNGLVVAWPELEKLVAQAGRGGMKQERLL